MFDKLSSFEPPILISKKQAEKDSFNHALAGVAIGFGVGVVVGATIAALAASKKDSEIFCVMEDAADEAIEDVKEGSTCFIKKVKAKIESKKSCCCQDEEQEFAELAIDGEGEAAPAQEEPSEPQDEASDKQE